MKIFSFFLGMILTFQTFSIVPCWAETNKPPFWAKQSSFMEGEDLFVVGIGLNAETVEEGRKRAFENAKVELMNFAQVTDVEAKGLVIETQTTFEETNPIGMITVYQLLRVPAKKLAEIQGHLQEQTRLQGQAVDKSQRDLQLVQQAMVSRYQRLEEQNRQIQETLDSMSRLQESLGEKALRFEQAHTEVEQLLQLLSAKVKEDTQPTSTSFASPAMNNNSTKNKSIAEPLLRRFKDTENKLDAQAAQLKDLSKRAKVRLAEEDELARALEKKCKYLVRGMTREEVGQIMSEPAEQYLHIPSKTSSSKYRYMNKRGATGIISVGFAYNELVDSLDGCPGKSFH